MDLRALAYRELEEGFDTVKQKYASIAGVASNSPAGNQSKALEWFHERPSNALLGFQVNGRYRIFLDGSLVAEGDSPLHLTVRGVSITEGRHVLTAEVAPVRPDAWFSLCLRTHSGNIITGASWQRARQRPSTWPDAFGDAGVAWESCIEPGDGEMLPRMGAWQLAPNAFVNMQSARQLLRPWEGWQGDAQRAMAYLRREFIWTEKQGLSTRLKSTEDGCRDPSTDD
jgi:hypothetical protein